MNLFTDKSATSAGFFGFSPFNKPALSLAHSTLQNFAHFVPVACTFARMHSIRHAWSVCTELFPVCWRCPVERGNFDAQCTSPTIGARYRRAIEIKSTGFALIAQVSYLILADWRF